MKKIRFIYLAFYISRPPNNYGSNQSVPRPEPSPPAATNTTMVPVEEDKIGGDGYGSSKMRASNWRLMGLGNDYLPD